jgi:hypothetical protein
MILADFAMDRPRLRVLAALAKSAATPKIGPL